MTFNKFTAVGGVGVKKERRSCKEKLTFFFFNKTGNLNGAETPTALRKGLKVKIPVQSQGHEKGKGNLFLLL